MRENDVGVDSVDGRVDLALDERDPLLLVRGEERLARRVPVCVRVRRAPGGGALAVVLSAVFVFRWFRRRGGGGRKGAGGLLECDGAEACGLDLRARHEGEDVLLELLLYRLLGCASTRRTAEEERIGGLYAYPAFRDFDRDVADEYRARVSLRR